MKRPLRIDYPSVELLEEEVARRQDRARHRERIKNLLLIVLALLWAWTVLR